jgi:hypothetical protein
MTELKTKPDLLEALRRASTRAPTAEEIRKQRVSFIMGTLKDNSSVSRERVQEILDRQEGRKAS